MTTTTSRPSESREANHQEGATMLDGASEMTAALVLEDGAIFTGKALSAVELLARGDAARWSSPPA